VNWNLGTILPGQTETVSIPGSFEYNTVHGTLIPFKAELRVNGLQIATSHKTVMVGSTFKLAGHYPIPICGDVNSDLLVDMKDLILIMESQAGKEMVLSITGDCNQDGKISIVEALEILNQVQ
jgi:hypothetical protein